MKPTQTILYTLVLSSLCFGCSQNRGPSEPTVTRITFVDRNGMTETVSSKDRLKRYNTTNFLQTQPYQKVTRLYSRDSEGNSQILLSSYHPNGQIRQYLEGQNGRALGCYQEWHANGQQKVEAAVIGGTADLDPAAEQSWVFDGCSRAWNAEGQLMAEIPYSRGVLQGVAQHYHPNGQLWKHSPYLNDQLHGTLRIYLRNGELLQETHYSQGLKHGSSKRFWSPDQLAFEEDYVMGRLMRGRYFDSQGHELSTIEDGDGFRAVLGKQRMNELHEFRDGAQNGLVKEFNSNGEIKRIYHLRDGVQHGEESVFALTKTGAQPLLSIHWHDGRIQGEVKSWYKNGTVESLREMSDNKKHGISTAWYLDGSLMLIEEYDNGRLVRGEYHRRGEGSPISQVVNGSGIATLFTPEGSLKRRIAYREGSPQE